VAVPEKDNRIRLFPTEVDFDQEVGVTGQAHDGFPAPGQQPRFDWMRSFLIGLLANQSSDAEPFEHRTGTLWFKRAGEDAMKVFDGSTWNDLSQHVVLEDVDGRRLSLSEWFDEASPVLDRIQPEVTFSGSAVLATTEIAVPDELTSSIGRTMRPFVHVNGLLLDPRTVSLSGTGPFKVVLTEPMSAGDRFTVIIEPVAVFVEEDVIAR